MKPRNVFARTKQTGAGKHKRSKRKEQRNETKYIQTGSSRQDQC